MSQRELHVVKHPQGWTLRSPATTGRKSAFFETQADAVAAGRELVAHGGGGNVVVHRADGAVRERDTVPAAQRRAPRVEGQRTTLRVPDDLAGVAELLAQRLEISRNDALLRLAARGAEQYARELRIAEVRDQRWKAIVAHGGEPASADFPLPEDAEAAVLDARGEAPPR